MSTVKLIPQDITLEKIKQPNYWDLMAIIIWNHYSEEKYQDESKIKIEES